MEERGGEEEGFLVGGGGGDEGGEKGGDKEDKDVESLRLRNDVGGEKKKAWRK